jgi:predicted anti-sigma-YlaC factor YlaD
VSHHPPADALLELHFGEASDRERARLEAHLRGCADCAAALAGLSRLERALELRPHATPPRDGLERVLARVAQLPASRRRRTDWALAALPSAVALLAGGWAVHAGASQLRALGLVPGGSFGPFSGELVGLSLAALGLVVLGALVTLALAPVLILESNGRS